MSTSVGNPTPSTTTAPTGNPPSRTLSCAKKEDAPTSIPSHIGCDNQNHNGLWLSSLCRPAITEYWMPYIYPGGAVFYLGVSLMEGSTTYLADSETCEGAFGEVLNGCAPFGGEPLVKYGGGVVREDGEGRKALWRVFWRVPEV
ncbi:MAG: hypothetical protein Q9182_003884 [Xanthomendoza sp. 2 TL-2023]